MQTTRQHVCHCGNVPVKSDFQSSQSQQAIFSKANVCGGEWVWSTSQGIVSPPNNIPAYASTSNYTINGSRSASYHTPRNFQLDRRQQGVSGFNTNESDDSFVPAWLSQNENLEGFWGVSSLANTSGSPTLTETEQVTQAVNAALLRRNDDFPVTPLVEIQDPLPIPGLVHSPSNFRAHDLGSLSTGHVMSSLATSSVGSIPSVPATPTSLAMQELDASIQRMANLVSEPSSQGLSSAFDFTNFPQSQILTTNSTSQGLDWPSATATSVTFVQPFSGCFNSAALTRTSTSISPLPMTSHVAMPAPGWLDPEVLPVEIPIEATHQMQQGMPGFGEWSQLIESRTWLPPATTATASRYEPYRNSSNASTVSNSSKGVFLGSPALSSRRLLNTEFPGSRRRSLTVGSLSRLSSSLVDRVRVVGATRPQTPVTQQNSVPSSPRLASSAKFNSMPCRRTRTPAPGLSSMFPQEVETASIKERRMSSLALRTKLTAAQSSPPVGLFATQELFLANESNDATFGGAEPSPTVSELSIGLSTLTCFTLSPPGTPAQAIFAGGVVAKISPEEGITDGTVIKAKIALHHRRTKLQRNVLSDVVTSLQGAYKHCRRQCISDAARVYEQSSQLASELGQLQLSENPDSFGLEAWTAEAEPSSSTSGLVVAGETKEMRKNRQKAESKMRMRRKEIAQFAALASYAKLAYTYVGSAAETTDYVLGRSLAQVFLEHRDGWTTLVALEKRLFHTVRVKQGLQELFVKKLTERLAEMAA